MPQHIKLFSTNSTSVLDVFLIEPGNVLPQVAQEASGWIACALDYFPPAYLWRCAIFRGHSGL